MEGGSGARVSTVMVVEALEADVLPATSVAFAVMTRDPSPSADVAPDQTPDAVAVACLMLSQSRERPVGIAGRRLVVK